jgi:hypothetical protein
MSIRCTQCGANNHSHNSACLTCGCELSVARPLAALTIQPPLQPPPVSDYPSPASAAESNDLAENVRYLFQGGSGELSKSHASRYFLLILLGLAAATAGWHWRDVASLAGRFSASTISASASAPTISSPSSTTPSPSATLTPQTANSASPEQTTTQAGVEETSPAGLTQQSPGAEPAKARIEPASRRDAVADTGEIEGEKHLYGDGVPMNCDLAQKELLAAAKHSAKAQTDLGVMYATGHCAIRDLPLAYRWFARAQHHNPSGDPRIAEDLKVLWNQMTPEERKLATP